MNSNLNQVIMEMNEIQFFYQSCIVSENYHVMNVYQTKRNNRTNYMIFKEFSSVNPCETPRNMLNGFDYLDVTETIN